MNFVTRQVQARPDAAIGLLAAYFLLNMIARLCLPNSLEIDEAAQILMGQWYALGYDTQPPLYNWVQHVVIDGLGQSLFALSLVKALFLFLSYLFYYLAARQVLSDRRLAVAAALGLLTMPEIGWLAQRDLTHSNASLFAACLFIFALFRTLNRPTILAYLLTGVAIGTGLLSKYNFAILCVCAFVAVLASPSYRGRIFDRRMAVTAAMAAVIVLPHALWLFHNFDIASQDTVHKLVSDGQDGRLVQIGRGLLELPVTALSYAALSVLIYAAVARRFFWPALRSGNARTRLVETMFLVLLLFLLCLVFFMGTAELKTRWVSPVLFLVPLYLCMKLDAYGGLDGIVVLKRFMPIVLVLMVLIPASLVLRIIAAGPIDTHPKLTVPYRDFIAQTVAKPGLRPALVIAEDPYLAGNLRMQLPHTPVDAQTYELHMPSYSWSTDAPILLVWRAGDGANPAVPAKLLERLKQLIPETPQLAAQTISLPYLYGDKGDGFRFGYAWVAKP